MPQSLTAFAPKRCLELRLLEPGSYAVQDATTLFVDLAGFSTLTDRLGKVGSRGTEELSHLLRKFFGSVADTLMERGGDPVAFGGDALTAVFDGAPDLALREATDSANEISRLVLEMARTATSAGPVTLQTKVGIARGTVTTAMAGSSRRSIPVHLGDGLDFAVAAESQALPGQVVYHPSSRVGNRPPPEPDTPTVVRATASGREDSALLARLVNPVVRGRLAEDRALLESHRSISVAFVNFAPMRVLKLPEFLQQVGELLELVDRFGGELVQIAGGDKGIVAMVVFGAPVAHRDDPLRTVQAMLELRRLDRTAAIGVATGQVFAALLGSDLRRFPAHSGQAINLAARLMQAAAPGQIVIENTTWQASHRHLRQSGPVVWRTVKGSTEPIETRAVAGWRRGPRSVAGPTDAPLVGRQAEMSAIERWLDDISANAGRLLTLAGESGIGKTRLVRETIQRATTRSLRVVAVDADDYPRGQASALWRELLGGLTGTPPRAGAKTWLSALTAHLPEREGQVPALGGLIGARLGTATANVLPPDLEAELIRDLVARLVTSTAERSPVVVVIENIQRLDQGSLDVLESVARALPESRAGVLATRRTEDGSRSARSSGTIEMLALPALSGDDVAQLAADIWRQSGGGSPPSWLAAAVRLRAGGNPLFVRVVATLLREQWEPGNPRPAEAFASGSMAGLVAEHVDQLSVPAHQLLNVLAVAHRPCSITEAAAFLAADVDQVSQAAGELAAEGLVRTDASDASVVYRTQHEILQQVVYEGLSHAERARLHRRIAEHLADIGANPIEVAEHVDRLNDPDLGRQWFPLAAAAARASWNFPGAAGWWQRALPTLAGPARDAAEVELLEVLLVAGRANDVISAADEAEARRGSVRPGTQASELRARFAQAVAEAALTCGDLDRSESAAAEAMALTNGVDEARHQRAAELFVLAKCARGDFPTAISSAEEHRQRAETAGDLRAVTTAHAALGAALFYAGRAVDAVTPYEKALSGTIALGNVVQQIHVVSDLAGCAFETGRYTECVEQLSRARHLADDIGYRLHLAFNLNNEAQLRAAVGDKHATSCASAAVRRGLEMGDLTTAADAVHTWVTARPATATDLELWRRLKAVDAGLGRNSVAIADIAEQAVAAARRSKTDDALRWADEAAQAAEDSDQPLVLRRATFARLLARLRASAINRPSDRAAPLALAEGLAESGNLSEVERAELAVEHWRLTRTPSDRHVAVALLSQAFAAEPSALVRHLFAKVNESPPAAAPALPPPVGIGQVKTTRAQLLAAFDRIAAAAGVDMTSL